jgi:hypothetical protein
MWMGFSRAAILAGSALGFAMPAIAGNFDSVVDNAVAVWTQPDGSEAEEADARGQAEYMFGRSLFILYHEFGHAMVEGYKLHVIVQEEAVADAFAGLYAIGAEADAARDALAKGAVRSFMDRAKRQTDNGVVDFSQPHLFDAQRGFNAMCMFIGGGSEARFGELADEFEMPSERRDSCAAESAEVGGKWTETLPDTAFVADGKTSTNTFTITYDEPSADMKRVADLLKASGLLEAFAAEVESLFELPRPIKMTAQDCGGIPNMTYYEDEAQIQVCYEYFETYQEMAIEMRYPGPQ